MNETEYKERLRMFQLSEDKFLTFIQRETGAIIKRRHIFSYFQRSETLSEPMTGLFRFAFNKLQEQDEQRQREIRTSTI